MGSLQVLDLHKRYGETVALDGVSFSVEAGEVCGFVGPNGAGKTTAMRIVLGVLDADSGEVRWGGEPIGVEARRRIGYMPEERGLYPKMRVIDQLAYLGTLHGLSDDDARGNAERWTERLGIAERGEDAVEALSLGNRSG
ncbi:MAG TPA: ATP-binding cassette domain-containing protein [Thermoleophilaceae bacterium]|nr:ATP-binding cassette domain-containing protein [Thermoleophilaceae bacterium]